MIYSRPCAFGLALGLTLLTILAGCDTSLQPFANDTGLYSVYGYLTLSGNVHHIRVRNINRPASADSTRVLDATVTLTNQATGARETLADSIVFFDGIYTHNFRTEQDLKPETSYRILIERSDGRTARATATMPPITDLDVLAREPVDCLEGPTLKFRNVSPGGKVQISIGVPWDDGFQWVHRDVPAQTGFVAWRVVREVLPPDVLRSVDHDSTKFCTFLEEDHFRLAYTHFGPDWPSDSVLTTPVASNIENGLGLFGGVHQDTVNIGVDNSPVR